jgi:gliding motility-associated-like protein
MKKIASNVLFWVLFPIAVFGQGETSNWHFGNGAGIRFNNDGSIKNVKKSKLDTFEGCATISDTFGELLFYTDGITVYNRDHEIMDNGEGLFGDPSSTQSALIVPKPEDPDLYYIFTVDTGLSENDPDFGLNYSVVDMALNAGSGAVTEKNRTLLDNCSEKITAVVKNCFERSIWVITLAAQNGISGPLNTFYAFEVNASGVQSTPVKTTFPNLQIEDERGYLKLSPDGTKLVSANFYDGLFIYDFNQLTGKATNQQMITIPGDNKNPYGVEFSPDSELLYVHSSNESDVLSYLGHASSLWQFDIVSADISASAVELDNRPIFRGALQQAENGKIYRTIAESYNQGTPYLGVVNNPNERGIAANYAHNAVYLDGKNAMQGLPPFIQSFFGNTDLIQNDDGTSSSTLTLCSGEPLFLEADSIPGATYFWEKDGIPLPAGNDYSYTLNSTVEGDSGRYRVEITPADATECPIIGVSLVNVLPIPDPNLSLTQCDIGPDDNNDGITFLNLDKVNDNPNLTFYFYATMADRNADNPIPNSSQYQNTQPFNQTLYYKVVNTLGCTNIGEIELQINPASIVPSAFNPVYTCDEIPEDDLLESTFNLEEIAFNYSDPNLEVVLYASIEDAVFQLNPLTEENINTASTSLYARLSQGTTCLGIERIDLVVNPSPTPEMEATYTLCTDSPGLQISGPVGFDSYRWFKKTGSGTTELGQGQEITISELGFYELETSYVYSINGVSVECGNSVNFQVIPSNKAVIQQLEVKDFASNNTVQVNVTGEGSYEYSLDGINYQESNYFSNVAPGLLRVYVRDTNGCGITEKDLAVMGYPKFFTPNGDGINDYWQITGINQRFQADAFIGIYDRYGTLITQISTEEQGWNGTINTSVLPAADYWFKVLLEDGREFKGHFTLKR